MEVEIERIWELLPTLNNTTKAADEPISLELACNLYKKEVEIFGMQINVPEEDAQLACYELFAATQTFIGAFKS